MLADGAWRLALKGAEIAIAILTIATVNFILVHSAPGDPAAVMAGLTGSADEVFMAQIRADYGLDKPYIDQWLRYILKVAQFDLGYSFRQREEVATLVAQRIGPTLLLAVSAIFVSMCGGMPASA